MKKEHTVNKAGYKTAVLTCDIGGVTVRLIKSCKNSLLASRRKILLLLNLPLVSTFDYYALDQTRIQDILSCNINTFNHI